MVVSFDVTQVKKQKEGEAGVSTIGQNSSMEDCELSKGRPPEKPNIQKPKTSQLKIKRSIRSRSKKVSPYTIWSLEDKLKEELSSLEVNNKGVDDTVEISGMAVEPLLE